MTPSWVRASGISGWRNAALGFEHVQLGLLGTEPAQLVERLASKIVSRLAELGIR